MWRKGNHLAPLVRMQTGAATLENSVEVPQKLKIDLPYDPEIALLGIYPRDTGMLMHRGTCTPMFITVLSTIAKLWKEPKCPSTDKWIKRICFIYTMEYYLAMRKNEIWPFVATWMELESVMLSEISHTEKDRYHIYHIYGIDTIFTLMWILRNLPEDHGGGEGKKSYRDGGRQTVRDS